MVSKRHLDVIHTIAEHRILTTSQLSTLHFGSDQATRRCVRSLVDHRLVIVDVDRVGRGRGRPQQLISVSPCGARALQDQGHLPADTDVDDVTVASMGAVIEHQILANWVRVLLHHLQRETTDMEVVYLSPTSPFRQQSEHRHALSISLPKEHQSDAADVLFPDGVCTLTHTPTQRSLLFYVEVDMATEPLASPSVKLNDVRSKLVKYRLALGKKLYKGSQSIVKWALNGFRVLLVVNAAQRAAALCRLVEEMAPMDFVWVTDAVRLLERGAGGHIWSRGGAMGAPPASIMGSLARPI